jgi:hypothetical protein
VVLRGSCGQLLWGVVVGTMKAEYHLIDLAYGVSHGGFRSLEAARQYAREEDLIAWDIFHGNARVEYHDPGAEQSPNQLALTAVPYHFVAVTAQSSPIFLRSSPHCWVL